MIKNIFVFRLLRSSRQQNLTFDSNLVPMLCPPQPWSTPHNGGYLLNKSDLIRLPLQVCFDKIKNILFRYLLKYHCDSGYSTMGTY